MVKITLVGMIGRGIGLEVKVLAFDSDDLSLNLADYLDIMYKNIF